MSNLDGKTFSAMVELSISVGITPPSTNDVYEWWDNGLKEISDYWLFDLFQCGFLAKSTQPNLKKMYHMLVNQIEKRQLLNTLA